jgi:nitrate reductase NapE component
MEISLVLMGLAWMFLLLIFYKVLCTYLPTYTFIEWLFTIVNGPVDESW